MHAGTQGVCVYAYKLEPAQAHAHNRAQMFALARASTHTAHEVAHLHMCDTYL